VEGTERKLVLLTLSSDEKHSYEGERFKGWVDTDKSWLRGWWNMWWIRRDIRNIEVYGRHGMEHGRETPTR
jgi:hypothetical protein